MSKRSARRGRKNLEIRRALHDDKVQGHHKPGSQNPKKTVGKKK